MKKDYFSPEFDITKICFEKLLLNGEEQIVSDPQVPVDGGDPAGAGPD